MDAHISDIMSCCPISGSHTFGNAQMQLTVKTAYVTDDAREILCHLEQQKCHGSVSYLFDKDFGLIIPAAFTSANQLINSVSHQISISPLLCGAT